MPPLIDLTDQVVGDWLVIARAENGGPEGRKVQTRWRCECLRCGSESVVCATNLRNGTSKRCTGCAPFVRSYVLTQKNGHGMRHSPTYNSWARMKSRILNPQDPKFPDYGGRGLGIHQPWVGSFTQFWNDLGTRPTGTTIGRIDNDLGYFPGNVKWQTATEQAHNRRPRRIHAQTLSRVAVTPAS